MKSSRFAETRWSLVNRASELNEDTRQPALDEILRIYTPALRSFLVEMRGVPADIADDLVQDFVIDKIICKQLLQNADRQKGCFRNFLLKSFLNYSYSKLKRDYSIKSKEIELDDYLISDSHSNEDIERYDREWAWQLIMEALHRMEKDCEQRKRSDLWKIFCMRVVDPLLNSAKPVEYERIVTCFEINTSRQAINLFVSAKRCFVKHLRSVVGQYVSGEQRINEELEDLCNILRS